MNKQEANQILDQLEEAYSKAKDEEFVEVYFNVGKNKDLKYCNGTVEARELLNEIPDNAKIAFFVDDIFCENVGDLEKAWKELDGEEA